MCTNKESDRHTKKSNHLESDTKYSRNVYQKNQRGIPFGTGDKVILAFFQKVSQVTYTLTDIHEIYSNLERLYKHPRYASKKFQK